MTEAFSTRKYLRDLKLPFCAGCGLFTLMNTFLKAVYELGYDDLTKFVFCSGIGCTSWIPSPYFVADSVHTLHGRSIPVATGIKLLRPDLNVVVFGGDGDIVGIGLSHFVHAARRNMDILVIMGNNMIYGMTGGQVASTTPKGSKTSTTGEGNPYRPFDLCKLVEAAGATYVARYAVTQPISLIGSIKKALLHVGFSFIDVLSPCPTQFGRRNRLDRPEEMIQELIQRCILEEDAKGLTEEELAEKIITGEFLKWQK